MNFKNLMKYLERLLLVDFPRHAGFCTLMMAMIIVVPEKNNNFDFNSRQLIKDLYFFNTKRKIIFYGEKHPVV